MAIQEATRCEGLNAYGQRCTRQLAPQDGPGRKRRFCGDTCRSAARRNREYRAMTRLPRCSWPGCAKRAASATSTNLGGHIESCDEHLRAWPQLAAVLGKGVELDHWQPYDIDGLKRAELLADEKHRLGIVTKGQTTVDELIEEELAELVDATEDADRHRQRQELVGDTGNVPTALRSSRCRNRHHDECDGHRGKGGKSQGLCLCTCHP